MLLLPRSAIVLLSLFIAAPTPRFDISDGRGKKPSGVSVEAGAADPDGWFQLRVTAKPKPGAVLLWPFDGRAKMPDGPGAIPVIVMEPGDTRALANARVVAAIAAGDLLGSAHSTGLDRNALSHAVESLVTSTDPFAKGVGLLSTKNAGEAVDPLALALKERERQLTRVPSEIYAAAMLYGRALFEAGKFDNAAVAFFKAMDQRPSDAAARRNRAEALIRAGKPEAAESLLNR